MSQSNYVAPSSGRAIINDTGWALEVEVPPSRPWSDFLSLSFWLVAWAVGEIVVGMLILESLVAFTTGSMGDDSGLFAILGSLFLLAWFGGWTVGGVFAIRSWLAMAFGREIITVSSDRLEIRRQTIGKAKRTIYHADHVRNLRVVYSDTAGFTNRSATMWQSDSGPLAFDYGADSVYFGSSLSDGEADLILGRVKEKMRRFQPASAAEPL